MADLVEFLNDRIAEGPETDAALKLSILRLHTFAERDDRMALTGRRLTNYHSCVMWNGADPEKRSTTICETLQALAAPHAEHADYDPAWSEVSWV